MNVNKILFISAIVVFVLAAFGVRFEHCELVPLGLALFAAAELT